MYFPDFHHEVVDRVRSEIDVLLGQLNGLGEDDFKAKSKEATATSSMDSNFKLNSPKQKLDRFRLQEVFSVYLFFDIKDVFFVLRGISQKSSLFHV